MSNRAVNQAVLVWVLIAEALVVLPFAASHPLWLFGLLTGCLLWRARALQKGWPTLRLEIKIGLLVLGLAILIASGYRQYDIDTMVAIVLLGFVLKVLELWRRRDTVMLVCTGLFLCASHFIYSQTLWQTLFTLVAVWALCACLVSMNTRPRAGSSIDLVVPAKTAFSLIALAAPLAVLLFFVVPRIPPLWSIPQQQRATTGLAEEVTPGDIANLVQSPEDAFRIRFFGNAPPRDDWYWRAMVFRDFDGRTWRRGSARDAELLPRAVRFPATWRYEVILEPTGQKWVPTLDTATFYNRQYLFATEARTLNARSAINSVAAFTVISKSDIAERFVPSAEERGDAVNLPEAVNPRLREWAQIERAKLANDEEFIEFFLRFIRDNEYFYTLRPPLLTGSDTLDEFWFDSRRGFCSHYASAFVFTMRSIGVPARMVGGYLGGRRNAEQNYITVRQMDAHAWAEVWLPNRGWMRVDPTSAVAPDRISQDLDSVFGDTPEFVAALAGRTRSFLPLQKLQLWLDLVEYQWQRWVVRFDESARAGFLDRLFGDAREWVQVAWLLGAFAAVAAIWFLLVAQRGTRAKVSATMACFLRVEAKLARRGVARQHGETLLCYLQRAARDFPDRADELLALASEFNELEYAAVDPQSRRDRLTRIRGQVDRL